MDSFEEWFVGSYPEANILEYYRQADSSILVNIFTPNDDRAEIEEVLVEKTEALLNDYDYEFVFVIKDKRSEREEEAEPLG